MSLNNSLIPMPNSNVMDIAQDDSQHMSLRIELFSADLPSLVDFYTRVLGFTLLRESKGYAYMGRGSVRIGAASAWETVDSHARMVPTGTEIVLEVDDLQAMRDDVVSNGWPLDADIKRQEWGLVDFRVKDPAGYYLRFTSRSKGECAGRTQNMQ